MLGLKAWIYKKHFYKKHEAELLLI